MRGRRSFRRRARVSESGGRDRRHPRVRGRGAALMSRRIGRLAILALASVAALGCSSERSKSLADEMRASAGADEFKIGIMTGAVARHEAEFRAAQQLERKYGSRLRHITYPD